LLSQRKFTLNEFDSSYTFKQTFLLSAGFTHQGPEGKENIDSLKTTKFGFGLKFSIIRPLWTPKTRTAYNNIVKAAEKMLANYRHADTSNRELNVKKETLSKMNNIPYRTPADRDSIRKLVQEINTLTENENDLQNKNVASTTEFQTAQKAANEWKSERKGLFLDFDAGFAYDFPDNRFGNGNFYRGGAWLTGGNENGNTGVTTLFIARYLFNPESVFADPNGLIKQKDISAFDAGIRLLLTAAKGRFILSGESIYRSLLGNYGIDPSWRLVFNSEYDVGLNKKLTFSFGRDFDGTLSKGGNLIAALNLIMGFGTERKL
jgi:hypothetical protein